MEKKNLKFMLNMMYLKIGMTFLVLIIYVIVGVKWLNSESFMSWHLWVIILGIMYGINNILSTKVINMLTREIDEIKRRK